MTSNTDTTKPAEGKEILIAGHLIKLKFQDILPAKTDEEIRILREDIDARGFLDKIVVWEKELILLDGYHRVQIYEELKLEKKLKKELEIEWLPFTSEEEAKMWMLQHQIIRRNLKTFQRVEAVLNLNDFYARMARENKKTAGKPLTQKFGEGQEVNEILGKLVNVSGETVRKVKKILDNEDNKDVAKGIEALRKGDPDVSIHSVYLKCSGGEGITLEPKLSKGLKGVVKETLGYFTALTDSFSGKADTIYICDEMIKWAREKKAKLTVPKKKKKSTKKASKKSVKKSVKKGTKKAAKKATKKLSKKK